MQHAASMRVSALVLAVFWPGAVGQTCSPAANSPMQGRTGTIKTDGTAQPKVAIPEAFAGEGWYQKAQQWVTGASRASKVALVNGVANSWNNQSLANPSTLYVGNIVGAAGLPTFNIQDNGNGFRPMTQEIRNTVLSWPGGAAVASTWDGELGEQVGLAMAEGHLAKGANVILGPAINLWLFPKGGRNGEYMTGESPLLGHQMAYHFVRGVQGPPDAPTGVIANAKHLTAYNTETNRLTVDSKVSQGLLESVFFPPFYGAMEAGVGSIMCSYNFVNGEPACASEQLARIKNVSLDAWPNGGARWPGFIMSDWWAIYGKGYASTNLDMAMPGSDLVDEINSFLGEGGISSLSDAALDEMALRIAGAAFRFNISAPCTPDVDPPAATSCCDYITNVNIVKQEHLLLARKVAADAVVLLRNEPVGGSGAPALPLDRGAKVVVVPSCDPPGYTQAEADDFHYSNGFVIGGSARVLSQMGSFVTIRQGLEQSGHVTVIYESNLTALPAAVAGADAVIACGWTNSSEEVDAPTLDMMNGEADINAALDAAQAAGKPAIVLISGRGPVLTPWRERTAAMASMIFGGEQAGHGWADVLTGAVNPSGKLIYTMPRRDNQGPEICEASETELIPCDYAAKVADFDAFQRAAAPHERFGFGLSYTTFEYSELHCDADTWNANVTVKNTGDVAGAEVVQLYVHHDDAPLTRNLAAFEKVRLAPGEVATLSLTANPVVRVGVRDGALFDLPGAELRVGALSCYAGNAGGWTSLMVYGVAIGGSLLLLAVAGGLFLCCRRKPAAGGVEISRGLIDEQPGSSGPPTGSEQVDVSIPPRKTSNDNTTGAS